MMMMTTMMTTMMTMMRMQQTKLLQRQQRLRLRLNRSMSSVLILSLPHRLASLLGLLPDLLAMTSLVVTAMGVVVVVQTVTTRAVVVASVGGLAVVGATVAATVTSVLERFVRRVHQPVNRPQAAAVMIRTGTSWTTGCGTIRSRLLRRCLHRL